MWTCGSINPGSLTVELIGKKIEPLGLYFEKEPPFGGRPAGRFRNSGADFGYFMFARFYKELLFCQGAITYDSHQIPIF
jgi:hypothetical protein